MGGFELTELRFHRPILELRANPGVSGPLSSVLPNPLGFRVSAVRTARLAPGHSSTLARGLSPVPPHNGTNLVAQVRTPSQALHQPPSRNLPQALHLGSVHHKLPAGDHDLHVRTHLDRELCILPPSHRSNSFMSVASSDSSSGVADQTVDRRTIQWRSLHTHR
jgi:hypothetical protein